LPREKRGNLQDVDHLAGALDGYRTAGTVGAPAEAFVYPLPSFAAAGAGDTGGVPALALVAGAVAITAIELGTPISSPLVKLCVLVAAPILALTTGDAALRIWRSAWAWMPTDPGKGLFRLVWFAAALVGIGVMIGVATVVLPA